MELEQGEVFFSLLASSSVSGSKGITVETRECERQTSLVLKCVNLWLSVFPFP